MLKRGWSKRFAVLAVLILSGWLGTVSVAQSAVLGVGLTGKVGSTGIGVDLTVPLVSNFLNVRLGYNNLTFIDFDLEEGGIDYNADFDFQNVPVFLDFHPFHGSFRLTTGLYYLKHDASLTATPTTSITVGGQTLAPGTAGTVVADVQFGQDWGPYLGVGWGNAADDNFLDLPIAIGFSLDLGLIYTGDSDVNITQRGGTVAITQANLNQEAAELEDALNDFPFYPVITLGIHVRF